MTYKNIWFLDDRNDTDDRYAEYLNPVFPEAIHRYFQNSWDALEAFEQNEAQTPEVILFDAFGYADETKGYHEFAHIMGWLKENRPDNLPKYILFMSADMRYAEGCKDLAIASGLIPKENIFSIEKREIFHASRLFDKENSFIPERGFDGFEFNTFLNDALNLGLPTTAQQLQDLRIRNNAIEPDEAVASWRNDELASAPTLQAIRNKQFYPYSGGSWVTIDRDSASWLKKEKLTFSAGSGGPIQGYAAFSFEEVRALNAERKPAILIVDRFKPEWYGQLPDLAGLIVMQSEMPGHLQLLADSHNVTVLIAPATGQEIIKHHEWLKVPQPDKPLARIQTKNGAKQLQYILGSLEAMAEEFRKENFHTYQYSGLKADTRKLWSEPAAITSGDELTIEGYGSDGILYKGHVTISPYNFLSYVPTIETIFHKVAEEYCRPVMHFKANIDAMAQAKEAYIYAQQGIGLVRTEHFAFTDQTSFQALHSIYTESADQAAAFRTLKERQQVQTEEMFDKIQEGISSRWLADPIYPIRIRLLDAPLEEVLSADEMNDLTARIPVDQQRGVQIGLLKPELYQNQLDAIFAAYKDFTDKPAPADEWFPDTQDAERRFLESLGDVDNEMEKTSSPITFIDEPEEVDGSTSPQTKVKIKLEIMVPTIKTLEELMTVKQMAREAAERNGLSEQDYSFGIMLETMEAISNIKTLTPDTDFISIGSNDLTSSVLGVSRSDVEKRKAFINPETRQRDPFVSLHPAVTKVIRDVVRDIRSVRKDAEIGLCGAHAADLASLKALRPARLTYVSTPPSGRNHYALAADWSLYDFGQWWNRRQGQLQRHQPTKLVA